jgi:cell division septal protein FtsQ
MFQQKRLLKKEKLKGKIRLVFFILAILLILVLGIEILYFNFVKVTVISPLAKSKVSRLVTLENELSKNQITFSAASANQDGSYTVKLLAGGEVILSSKKDIGSQLSSLQLMLSRLTIEGKKLKTLDFRFDNPVVSF